MLMGIGFVLIHTDFSYACWYGANSHNILYDQVGLFDSYWIIIQLQPTEKNSKRCNPIVFPHFILVILHLSVYII